MVGRGLRDIGVVTHLQYGDAKSALAPVPGMSAWFDAADTSTLTIVSNAVSAWADKSGNGYSVTQGTAGARPRYTSDTINGVIVPHFDGSDDVLIGSVGNVNCDNTSSWFLVGVGSSGEGPAFGNGGSPNGPLHFGYSAGGTAYATASFDTQIYAGTAILAANVPHAIGIRCNGSTITVWPDGNSTESGSGGPYGTADIAFAGDKGNRNSGSIAEVIGYNSALSDGDMVTVMTYLRNKWGTP